MDYEQSNTQAGTITAKSSEDLSEKNGFLAKLIDGGSIAEAALPDSVTDLALHVIVDGGDTGESSGLKPLSTHEQVHIKAKGTGNAGTPLVLADPSTPADAGKVRAAPATAGLYYSPGIAEEDFVDGQLVLVRPMPRILNVSSADTLTALTFSATATAAEVGALRAAILAILRAHGLVSAA